MFASLQSAREKSAYEKRFMANREENLFMGSFDSFEHARSQVPASHAAGYDNAEGAKTLYSHQIYNWDYPALFWIGDAVQKGMHRIFDLGGHVGIKYYAFRRVIDFPAQLTWQVCDLPGVVETGRVLAAERDAGNQLRFGTDWREADGTDVLFISGALQYLPTTLAEILGGLPHKPRRVLLNTTAMHGERTIFTHNSIGFGICPYRIQHQEEIQRDLVAAGYRRRDAWINEGKPITVPFVDGGDLPYYGGMCFDAQPAR
ncbi:TIGR04325 family methyltransferase [Variovorax sp.]|uniref:TIGR04325 family methyltransferase n=1 Tax=Variovorax sp. TaxID=1871043 RepID=UPI002D3707A2|nr:TIGR04325 family methyltransferase [Variovorax sp.]HYP83599.1 TIGR04325 family methyltransferase [Variovorax sp.]